MNKNEDPNIELPYFRAINCYRCGISLSRDKHRKLKIEFLSFDRRDFPEVPISTDKRYEVYLCEYCSMHYQGDTVNFLKGNRWC